MQDSNGLSLSLLFALGCGGAQVVPQSASPGAVPAPAQAASPAPSSEPSHAAPPPVVEAPATPDPTGDGDDDGTRASGGRLAFKECDAGARPQMCTKEYRPVCGEVDNGIRCVKAPCPSTSKRTFGNACSACSEARTTGYWPIACEELTRASAP